MKTFYLSVIDFAQPSPIQGSIETYSGFRVTAPLGLDVHQQLQQAFSESSLNYQSEISIFHRFKHKGITFQVSGRIDGIYEDDEAEENGIILEEIKSTLHVQPLVNALKENFFNHPYWLQLQTYGYFYWKKHHKLPRLRLLIVSLRTKEQIPLSITLDINAYETWLEARLSELAKTIQQAKKRSRRRQKVSNQLVFPFNTPRPSQQDLMDTVSETLLTKESLLIQAPTGLGKTLAVLLPVLKEALGRGQKTLYVTPKNSQHREVKLAVSQLQTKTATFKTVFLSSKKKLCLKEEIFCNSQYCEFAKDHFTKVEGKGLLKKSARQIQLDGTYFQKIGKKYTVCPYELQMQSLENVDLIVGDYNYVFSPSLKNGRVVSIPFGESDKPNLILDEAHNLPHRGLAYYSSTLSLSLFEKLADHVNALDVFIQEKMRRPLKTCTSLLSQYVSTGAGTPHCIDLPLSPFQKQLEKLNRTLSDYFESNIAIERNDPLLTLHQYWSDFTTTLENVQLSSAPDVFFTWVDPQKKQIKITCCNASRFLKDSYLPFANVIGFSATLKPFDYYSQLMGLEKARTVEFSTPFKKTQRKLLFIPQVSTQYTLRGHHQSKLIEVIQRITQLKMGNYLIFFPSFDYLEQIFNHFPSNNAFTLLRQSRGMHEHDIKALFAQLEIPNKPHLVFAVQGGLLSEGMNYKGDLAIGVFIIGPPLPVFSWERSQIQRYYQKTYQAGIEYAAIYPAMAKVVQAAGRVIRSESDKGLIVLLDRRLLEKKYVDCMPKDWYKRHPKENVSTTILADINTFWEGAHIESEAHDPD